MGPGPPPFATPFVLLHCIPRCLNAVREPTAASLDLVAATHGMAVLPAVTSAGVLVISQLGPIGYTCRTSGSAMAVNSSGMSAMPDNVNSAMIRPLVCSPLAGMDVAKLTTSDPTTPWMVAQFEGGLR